MGDRLDNSIALQMKGPLSSPNTVVTWDSAAHSREDLFLKMVHLMQHFEKSSKKLLFKKSPVCKFCLPME